MKITGGGAWLADHQTPQWETFKIGDLFEVRNGYFAKRPPTTDVAGIPFVGSSGSLNGTTGFISEKDLISYNKDGVLRPSTADENKKKIMRGGCISIANDGSVGETFYWKNNITSNFLVTFLYLKEKSLNENLALFLTRQIRETGKSFSYGMKWKNKRLLQSKILLPIDDNGSPNWDYMEQFVAKIEHEKLTKYKEFVFNQILNLL